MSEFKIKVEITESRFNKLVENLQPGSFMVVATEGKVEIRGMWVDYVWTRA